MKERTKQLAIGLVYEQLRQFLYYFGIIFFFAIGAGVGGVMSLKLGITTIWVSSVLLLISFLLMFLEKLR